MAPLESGDREAWAEHLSGLAGDVDVHWNWETLEEYHQYVEESGIAPNVGTLVGHGTVRYDVMGMDDREPTADELERMADRTTAALEDGALGFSTGLIYSPQINATTEELRMLVERLAPYGRPFVAHIRSEGRWVWDALDEFVDVGAAADVPLHLSHFKVTGEIQHGKAGRALELVEAARERGRDLTADQYPYTAGNTMLTAVLPPWSQVGGPAQTKEYLADEEARERMRRDMQEWRIDGWENIVGRSGWENVVLTGIDSDEYADLAGSSVADAALERDRDPLALVCDLLLEENLDVSMIVHHVDDDDMREILASERVNVATDGLFGSKPHPRTYGTYPLVLGQFVREENLLTLEEAVRKMTSLPARAMGLQQKGIIRPGMDADLVVFDPVRVKSRSTFEHPRRHPEGITHVLVDGSFIVKDEAVTGELPGEVIRK
jgi:N-acyl-D-amino-acid deacylase